jgi:Uma2 family endonuclease
MLEKTVLRSGDDMLSKTRLTPDDLLQLPDDEVRRELVNGEIVEMPLANLLHGKLALRVGRLLGNHVEIHSGGEVVLNVGFILEVPGDPDRVRGPDVAFISAVRLPQPERAEKFYDGAPDLAVEVLSPSEKSADVQQKVRDYLDAGARLVWVIAPQSRTATVYRPDGSARWLRERDALEGEDVLPGLSIPLAQIFD